jgi:hypothetical protein
VAKKGNKATTNFTVEVLSFIENYNSSGEKTDGLVEVVIKFKDKEGGDDNKPFTIPLSKLNTFDWTDHNPHCELPPSNRNAAKITIANHIRKKLPKPQKRYRIDKTGLQIIETEAVFCTGNEIIRAPPSKENPPRIEAGSIPYGLEYDSSISKKDAIRGMLILASLCDAGRLLLVYNLMWIMRAAYDVAWTQPRFCLFLYAVTNSLKTAYAKSLSNYKGSPPRLDSSLSASASIINSQRDKVVIFDDLCPSKDVTQQRKQEYLLNEITRWIGDETTPAKKSGNNVIQGRPESGVIFTGEYEVGEGSSATRLLLVKVEGIDEQKLGFFQKNMIAGSFYRSFIFWYVCNYHRVAEFLEKKWCDHYSKIDFGVPRRFRETIYFLETSHLLLMSFCVASNVITEDKAIIYQQSFSQMVISLIQEQDKRVKPDEVKEHNPIDHFTTLCAWVKSGNIHLTDAAKKFDKDKHDGFIEEGYLHLFSPRLNQKTRMTVFGGASSNDIWKSIEEQGALIRPNERERTIQIKVSRNKNERFYQLPLSKLK